MCSLQFSLTQFLRPTTVAALCLFNFFARILSAPSAQIANGATRTSAPNTRTFVSALQTEFEMSARVHCGCASMEFPQHC